MSIPKMTNDLAVIQKLSDLPNSTEGLTSDQLKAKFDEAALEIQKYTFAVQLLNCVQKLLRHKITAVTGAVFTII